MSHIIIIIPGNREESFYRPTCEVTEDIPALLLLIHAVPHTVIDQDGIKIPNTIMMMIMRWLMLMNSSDNPVL